MNWELTLRYADSPQRIACAWFVPGQSAGDWLTALAALPIDPARAHLLVVPQSPTDRRPLGALVVQEVRASGDKTSAAPQAESADSRQVPFVHAYGKLAGRLFLPVEAVLSPPATEAELKELLADDQLYVWHPSAGLVPFAPADCLCPADLLTAPAESVVRWDSAAPGVAYNSRLLSLSATVTPSLEQLIETARGEIGSKTNELSSLPPSPREPRPNPITNIKRSLTAAFARFALWLSKLGSGQGGQSAVGQGVSSRMRTALRRAMQFLLFVALAALFVGLLVWLLTPDTHSVANRSPYTPPPVVPSSHSFDRYPPSSSTSPGSSGPRGGGSFAPSLLLLGLFAGLLLWRLGWTNALLTLRRALVVILMFVLVGALVVAVQSHSLSEEAFEAVLAIIAAVILGLLLSRALFHGGGSSVRTGGARSSRPTPPRTASGKGWLARLGAWAAVKLQQTRESIEFARHREIERLVHLLDSDPDAGLRFALPLAGDVWRGVGAPGTQLTSRTVEFDAAGVRGGAADPWQIREDYRRKLTQQYRTLANREMSLGRHRRAAYILGQLLGDWTAAAKTLADGGHYREAAVVYDERLKRPLEAASCLENGGLLTEAIVIYERLHQHEKVGDLYAQLEQPDEAARSFRRAVDSKRAAFDRLGAATSSETTLHAPDAAWDELIGGWPAAPQAEGCLREAFDWTERRQDFDRAKQLLRDASARAESSGHAVHFAQRASTVATEYPEPTVRAAAAESVLEVASPRLPRAMDAELTGLTAALRRLAPADRLLSRDCDRFVRERAERDKVLSGLLGKTATQPTGGSQLRLHREIKLPFDNVRSCVASADTFYAAGWRGRELLLIRGNWHGAVQYPDRAPWKFPEAPSEAPIFMAVESVEEEALIVHPFGQKPADYRRTFPPTDQFRRAVRSGAFDGLSSTSIALSAGAAIHAVELTNGAFVVRAYRPGEFSLAETVTCDLENAFSSGFELFLPLAFDGREGVHYVGGGNSIYFIRGSELKLLFECEGPVVRLIASPAHTRPRLIASLGNGAQIFWGVVRGSPSTLFAQDMIRPQVLIHRDGWIIAADRAGCAVFNVERDALRQHLAEKWSDRGEVVALLPMQVPNFFAVSFDSGQIVQYQIPRP